MALRMAGGISFSSWISGFCCPSPKFTPPSLDRDPLTTGSKEADLPPLTLKNAFTPSYKRQLTLSSSFGLGWARARAHTHTCLYITKTPQRVITPPTCLPGCMSLLYCLAYCAFKLFIFEKLQYSFLFLQQRKQYNELPGTITRHQYLSTLCCIYLIYIPTHPFFPRGF